MQNRDSIRILHIPQEESYEESMHNQDKGDQPSGV